MADYSSDRQRQARQAYGNPEKSIEIHGASMETFNLDIRKNGAMRNRALVLSSLAGLCTAAGVVAVVMGAPNMLQTMWKLRNMSKVLVWTVAGGVSIAYVVTSSFSFERQIYDLELRREIWEIENHLSGELQEMISIYRGLGLSEEEALIVTRIFAKQKTLFANLMMVEELGYSRLEPPTTSEALTNAGMPAVLGFVVGLVTPLLPLMGVLTSAANVGPTGLTTRAKLLSAGVFLACNALVSYVQTEIFFGAYARAPVLMRTTLSNAAGVGSVFGLSYMASRYA
jgi:vacuolar iron transporter family protein